MVSIELIRLAYSSFKQKAINLMISLKEGVKLTGLKPEMVVGFIIVSSIYEFLGYDCVITSGLDGAHSKTSLHYAGCALDFRTRQMIASDKKELSERCKEALGEDFDVVLEQTHLHVEYQPRR